jgi:UDP-glucose 4-epimerase
MREYRINGIQAQVKRKVLVTGGIGFVGGRLAQSLTAGGDSEVILGSRIKHTSLSWLPNAKVIDMDLNSEQSLLSACKGIDLVVHLASMNDTECLNDPAAALQVNAVNTARLVEAAKVSGVKRIIYLSTAHVYSPNLIGRIDETTLPKGRHPYATSHRAAEDVVLAAANADMESIVIRLSNGFGVPAHPNVNAWMLLVNDLCRQAVTSKIMVMRSSGLQQRDFITLDDVTRAIDHMLNLPKIKLGDGLFNVGNGKSMRVIDMVRLIQMRCTEVLGFTPKIIRPEPTFDEKSENLHYCVEKLLSTGFNLNRKTNDEIDELLRMCKKNFTVAN